MIIQSSNPTLWACQPTQQALWATIVKHFEPQASIATLKGWNPWTLNNKICLFCVKKWRYIVSSNLKKVNPVRFKKKQQATMCDINQIIAEIACLL